MFRLVLIRDVLNIIMASVVSVNVVNHGSVDYFLFLARLECFMSMKVLATVSISNYFQTAGM